MYIENLELILLFGIRDGCDIRFLIKEVERNGYVWLFVVIVYMEF